MKQRGQVTLIIILGILALFVVLFLFYARDQIIEKVTKTTNVQQQLKLELTQIEKDISVCINKETTGILKTIKIAAAGKVKNKIWCSVVKRVVLKAPFSFFACS